MQINTTPQLAGDEEVITNTDTIGASQQLRQPATGGFSAGFASMYGEDDGEQDKIIRQEIHTKVNDWLANTPGVTEADPTASAKPGVLSEIGAGVATAPLSMVEDVYNTGVDLVNYVSKSFGGDEVMKNSRVLNQLLPNNEMSVISREITKFAMGYGALIKVASKAHKTSTALGKMSQSFAAGATTDLVTAQPEADSLFEELVKKLPYGADLVDIISDEDDTNFNKRVREVIYGGMTGVLAETMIKALRHYRKSKQIIGSISEPPPVPKADGVEDIPKVQSRDELPPLPDTDFISADLKPMDDAKARSVRLKQATGQGEVNVISGATDEGNVFINLTKMNTTDDIRRVVSNIVSENPDKYARQTYSVEDITQLAADLNMTPEKLDAWTKESGLKMGEIFAARSLADEAASSAHNALKRLNEGLIDEGEAALHFANFERIQSQVRSMENLSGLLLREAGIPTTEKVVSAKTLAEYKKIFGTDIKRIAKEVENGATPSQLSKAISKKAIAPVADFLAQMRYAGMLSNPATHVRNVLGTSMNLVTRVGESTLAASFNAIKQDPHGVTFGEAYHEALGMFQGTLEAFQIASQKMKGVEGASFLGVNPNKAKIPEELMLQIEQQTSSGSPIVRGLKGMMNGKFVAEALRFEDDFMKHINARMTLNREAYKKGFLEGSLKGKGSEDVAAIVAKELDNPSDVTLQKMFQEAEYNTFTNEVKGSVLQSLDQFSRGNPIMRLVAPFARTNLNTLSYKLERIPGLNLLLETSRKELNHIDPSIRQRAMAKMTFAATTMTALAGYLHSQDAIIGTGPTQSERWKIFDQSGRMRNSIVVGGKSIEFRAETPLGGILSMIADIAELSDITDDQQMIQDAGLVATTIVANALNPDYLTSSIGDLMAAMASGDADKAKEILEVGASVGTQFLPYSALIRGINRELTEAGAIKRETVDPNGTFGGLVSTYMNRIKDTYYPSSLAVRRDILGYPMKHKHGLGMALISPFGTQDVDTNPVKAELFRLSGGESLSTTAPKFAGQGGFDSDFISVQMPSRTVELKFGPKTQKRKLSPDEYEKLVTYSAGIHPRVPKTLEQSLSDLFGSESYKRSSLMAQGTMAKLIISKYREYGKLLFTQQVVDMNEVRSLAKEVLKEYADDDTLE